MCGCCGCHALPLLMLQYYFVNIKVIQTVWRIFEGSCQGRRLCWWWVDNLEQQRQQ
jgi:hypothetical protein